MKYEIIINADMQKQMNEVNKHLQEGWKLYGGPYILNHNMCQAMTYGDNIRPARLKEKKG